MDAGVGVRVEVRAGGWGGGVGGELKRRGRSSGVVYPSMFLCCFDA